MNLAAKDIRYHRLRFLISTVGVGLLLMVVLTIGGIIRGIILDSATIIQDTGADLWVVQKHTLGPFVEISRLPEYYYHAIQAINGVADTGPLVTEWEHVFRPPRPTPLMKFLYMNTVLETLTMVEPGWLAMPTEVRFIVIGYQPGHVGGPPNLIAGRDIEASRYEIVADVKTGFHLGERVRLGNFDYTVVGLTKNDVGYTADPVVYADVDDAQEILFEFDPDLLRNQRRYYEQQIVPSAETVPRLAQPLSRQSAAVPENIRFVNAIAVKLRPGVSPETVASQIGRWKHLEVFTAARQVNLQLMGSNRLILLQLSLFRLLLLLIVGIVIGFVVYTFTLDKLKEIAVLKLLGAKESRIFGMIVQQALLMGVLATIIGAISEFVVEPYFPRRVVTTYGDIGQLLVATSVIAIMASLMAIRRANKVEAASVLGG